MDDQIIQITVSSGPSLVEMPDIIGFTQANASKKLDALGIQYKMVMVDNDGTMAAGCVAEHRLQGRDEDKHRECDCHRQHRRGAG